MKTKIFEGPGKVVVEHDPNTRTYIANWSGYLGPHFREAVNAMIGAVKVSGIDSYIANASMANDVPTQEDFRWGEEVFTAALVAAGIRRFITVVPTHAIAKLGANRFNKIASNTPGVDTYRVASLTEALSISRDPLDPK